MRISLSLIIRKIFLKRDGFKFENLSIWKFENERNIVCLFLSFCGSVNAQTRGTAAIECFAIDSIGTISWEIKYTDKEIVFQIEEFLNGKWMVFNSIRETVTVSFVDQKEFFNKNKYLYKGSLPGSRFRLKITHPIILVSKELEYKK